jgi:ribosomal protein L35AE/L33A
MKAKLVAFKGRRRDVINNYGIIEVQGASPALLIGRKVSWRSDGGKTITGVVIRTHGKRALLARFKKGLPGDALGSGVTISPVQAEKKKPVKKKAKKSKKKPAKRKKTGTKSRKTTK